MIDLSDKKALVYDYYNMEEVAIALAKDFGEVYYTGPYVINGFEEHGPADIGRNVPNIKRVKDWASVIDEVDLCVTTDSHEPWLQQHWKNLGKKVFGSFFACELEKNRKEGKRLLKELGLPVGSYAEADGVDQLEQILMNTGHGWVKGGLRGDGETWEHKDWRLSKGEISRIRSHLKIYQNQPSYIVEQHIDGIAEIGKDIMTAGGRYPYHCMAGVEIKDCAYVCRIVPYRSLPSQLTDITDRLAPVFESMGYQGSFSDEVIIGKDKRGYMEDFTCRFGQPPTSIMTSIYTNFSEIIWMIASGLIPEIKFEHEWGVQLVIKSDIAEDHPSPIIVPDEYKPFVKIKNLVIDDDGTWNYTPMNTKMKEIGACIGMGHSLDDAMKKAVEVASSIIGFDTYIKTDSLDKAKKSLEKLSKAGIQFI